MTLVVVFIVAVVASVSLRSSSPGNSTKGATAECVFTNQPFTVSAPQTRNFQECLAAGSSHAIEFSLTANSSWTISGTIKSEFPVGVQLLEFGFETEGVLFSQNDTTSANFSNIHLIPAALHEVYITNLGRNNSMSISLLFS